MTTKHCCIDFPPILIFLLSCSFSWDFLSTHYDNWPIQMCQCWIDHAMGAGQKQQALALRSAAELFNLAPVICHRAAMPISWFLKRQTRQPVHSPFHRPMIIPLNIKAHIYRYPQCARNRLRRTEHLTSYRLKTQRETVLCTLCFQITPDNILICAKG